jgi:hypothetical protein
MTEEPSVLDYVKSKLAFWNKNSLKLPLAAEKDPTVIQSIEALIEQENVWDLAENTPVIQTRKMRQPFRLTWFALAALLMAIIAQVSLEPGPNPRVWTTGAIFYGLSLICLIVANLRGEWPAPDFSADFTGSFPISFKLDGLILLIPLTVITFIAFAGGFFTPVNVILWGLTIAACLRTFWLKIPSGRSWWGQAWEGMSKPGWNIILTRAAIGVAILVGLVLFFRLYRINQVPSDMISDHAEKLLDVYDVLQGKTAVYFPRNTGREFFQFYLTAAIISLFHTGFSYLSLKLGTIAAGLVTLPFIYLLGKEVANRRVGLIAFAFAGIAYWPNVISRFGLRFPFYPLFVAPTLYYLLRGIRTQKRNDFIFAGIALGIGLHGYSPIRILPFVVLVAVGLYLLHRQSRGMRRETIYGLAILVVVSFIVFLPLFRYALDNPDMFNYRTLTRLGTIERPLPGPAGLIFTQNLWNAMTMFFWSDGEVWVHSIPLRPALDIISAALFFIGMVMVVIRYLRRRNWLDLFLLLSIPLLMLPSILSLAFPNENPSLNRTGGAYVIVFVIIGLALDGFFRGIESRVSGKIGAGIVLAAGLLLFGSSSYLNYYLVFNQYAPEFTQGAWNTSEMGAVIKSFADTYGSIDTAWVVGYAYWVDTRLVGVSAGDPTRDTAIWPDSFAKTVADPRAKLFMLSPEDKADLTALRSLYPQALVWMQKSQVQGKDFWVLLIPPQGGASQ